MDSAQMVCPKCRGLFEVHNFELSEPPPGLLQLAADAPDGFKALLDSVLETSVHYSGTGECKCGARNMVTVSATVMNEED